MNICVQPFLIFLLFGGQCYVRCDEYDYGEGNYQDNYEEYDFCDVTVSVEDQGCKMDDLKELDDLNTTMRPLCCPGQNGFLHNFEICDVGALCHTQICVENQP